MCSRFIIFFILFFSCANVYAFPFLDNKDGTITDKANNLVWQKCSTNHTSILECTGSTTKISWSNSLNYCKNLTLSNKSWRLPNVNELYTLVDQVKKTSPLIDTSYFPNTQSDSYWTSTTSIYLRSRAFAISYKIGEQLYLSKSSGTAYVRCVSGP
jgi:hypothetical protein